MTVVVAAICKSQKAVVLAADRAAVLDAGEGPLQYDAPESKIRVLRGEVAIALAGGSEDGLGIINRIGDRGLAEIPGWIDNERKTCRTRFIEKSYETISQASPFWGGRCIRTTSFGFIRSRRFFPGGIWGSW
jgi:hypothetical protein